MLGEAFGRRAKHHEGIKALWETKWEFPVSYTEGSCCLAGVGIDSARSASTHSTTVNSVILSRFLNTSLRYGPRVCDNLCASVSNHLLQNNINDAYTDAHTEAFFPTCDALLEKAETAIAE